MKGWFPRLMAAVTAATLLAACAPGRGGSDPFSQSRTVEGIKIYIDNVAFMDATVYGVINGARQRLGRVTGKTESVFTMPLKFPSEMYLEIDIMAGPKCRTERIIADPGDSLELVIRTDNPYMFCGG